MVRRITRTHSLQSVCVVCQLTCLLHKRAVTLRYTLLANPYTLCYTQTIYTLLSKQSESKIPLQSIIHTKTFQNQVGNDSVAQK